MSVALTLLMLAVGAYLVAVLESWFFTGRLSAVGPLAGGLALLGRESLVPRKPDRIFFEVAPPLSPNLIVADLATGALFVNAALAYVMVALVMAGWGPG